MGVFMLALWYIVDPNAYECATGSIRLPAVEAYEDTAACASALPRVFVGANMKTTTITWSALLIE